jgi:DNA polymerase-3 subunit epsilon
MDPFKLSKSNNKADSMGLIEQETFVCLDCETTGLDPAQDRIIEVAATTFTFDKILSNYETLIDPLCPIPAASIEIHHISDAMVQGKPKIAEVLPILFKLIDAHIVIGHGISLDIAFLCNEAKRHQIPCTLAASRLIDTLRLARLYGESPINSLEMLRQHFNIAEEGAHRAMNDVVVNIEVFKHLATQFKTTEQLMQRLERPIQLKAMPLGKHKGRPLSDIPIEYLQWAAHKDFDQDLLYSIRGELKRRKSGNQFKQAGNPFNAL